MGVPPSSSVAVAVHVRVPSALMLVGGVICTDVTVGLVFSTSILILWLFNFYSICLFLLSVLSIFAFLESVFGYCFACKVFKVLIAMGLIPETICERCAVYEY